MHENVIIYPFFLLLNFHSQIFFRAHSLDFKIFGCVHVLLTSTFKFHVVVVVVFYFPPIKRVISLSVKNTICGCYSLCILHYVILCDAWVIIVDTSILDICDSFLIVGFSFLHLYLY